MKFSAMKAPSKYLTKEDVDPRKLVTIRKFAMETIEGRGKSEDKWILYFAEFEKGMVLNPTNQKLMQMALGLTPDSDTNDALGKKIVIWNDPSVQDLNGELVGGIRIRKANLNPAAQAAPAQRGHVQPQRQPGGMAGHFAGQAVGQPTYGDSIPPGATVDREPGSDDGDFDDEIAF